MSKQKIYYISVAAVLIAAAVIFWGIKNSPKMDAPEAGEQGVGIIESDIRYYCNSVDKFCINMEKYFAENKIEEKIFITKKDILKDSSSLKERDIEASGCGLDEKKIGTPFLFAEGKCFVGEAEVKGFFEKKLKK